MSAPESPSVEQSAAAAIQLRAAEWVMEQNEAGQWNDAQQHAFEAWLSASPSHLLAYWRLKAAWDRTHRLAALRSHPLGADRAPLRKSRWHLTFGVLAATMVIAATVGWFAFGTRSASEKVYRTPLGGHEVITLADGSSIELNTATEIRVGSRWRTVELVKGEAYFQIKHDSSNPFTVLASGHRVIDLGTKFIMRTNGKRLQVTLLNGSVRFESASSETRKHSEVLKPGDIAIATANSVSIEQSTAQALSDASAWRRGMLVFRDATLAEAAAEFNRYNNEQIVVHGSRAANLKIDGSFHAENVAGFTNMAQHVLDLHVRRTNGEIAISD